MTIKQAIEFYPETRLPCEEWHKLLEAVEAVQNLFPYPLVSRFRDDATGPCECDFCRSQREVSDALDEAGLTGVVSTCPKCGNEMCGKRCRKC